MSSEQQNIPLTLGALLHQHFGQNAAMHLYVHPNFASRHEFAYLRHADVFHFFVKMINDELVKNKDVNSIIFCEALQREVEVAQPYLNDFIIEARESYLKTSGYTKLVHDFKIHAVNKILAMNQVRNKKSGEVCTIESLDDYPRMKENVLACINEVDFLFPREHPHQRNSFFYFFNAVHEKTKAKPENLPLSSTQEALKQQLNNHLIKILEPFSDNGVFWDGFILAPARVLTERALTLTKAIQPSFEVALRADDAANLSPRPPR